VGEALDACKQAYDWTVIDAPRIAPAVAAELAQHSIATVLLLQLTIKDIRVARQMLTSLRERGVPADAIYLVANRYRKRGTMVRIDEAMHALGLNESQELLTTANDFCAVTEAVNLGRRLVDAAPRSDFRRDLQKLAATIAKARAASVSNEALAKAFV
jgi:Flp pilus assembly CpaE family ATPase